MNVTVQFDGGCQPNPGKGYGSYQISLNGTELGIIRLEFLEYGDNCTSNIAEHLTLSFAIQRTLQILTTSDIDPSTARLSIIGDSLLVLNQVGGKWKTKNALLKTIVPNTKLMLSKFGSFECLWKARVHNVALFGH